jgi:hypothetical protein
MQGTRTGQGEISPPADITTANADRARGCSLQSAVVLDGARCSATNSIPHHSFSARRLLLVVINHSPVQPVATSVPSAAVT